MKPGLEINRLLFLKTRRGSVLRKHWGAMSHHDILKLPSEKMCVIFIYLKL